MVFALVLGSFDETDERGESPLDERDSAEMAAVAARPMLAPAGGLAPGGDGESLPPMPPLRLERWLRQAKDTDCRVLVTVVLMEDASASTLFLSSEKLSSVALDWARLTFPLAVFSRRLRACSSCFSTC